MQIVWGYFLSLVLRLLPPAQHGGGEQDFSCGIRTRKTLHVKSVFPETTSHFLWMIHRPLCAQRIYKGVCVCVFSPVWGCERWAEAWCLGSAACPPAADGAESPDAAGSAPAPRCLIGQMNDSVTSSYRTCTTTLQTPLLTSAPACRLYDVLLDYRQ